MQRLEVSGAVRPIYGSLGVRRLRLILVMSVFPLFILNVMYLSLIAVCTVVTSVIQNILIFAVRSAQAKFRNLGLHELCCVSSLEVCKNTCLCFST